MDPTAFATVKYEVRRLPCIEDKIQAVVYAQGNLYAEQVAELLNETSFDEDKMKLLQSACPKMLPASCIGILPILRTFRSDNKRVQAVELVSRQVTDPLNFPVLNEVFPYARERDTIRGIMTRQASTAPPPPPPTVVHTVGNPYPYGRPTPRVDPNDPVYRMAEKTVDVVAGGIASMIAPRSRPGVVVNRPGAVVYQTTTVASGPPGVQVIQTGPGYQPAPGTQYVYTAQHAPPPYPQQQYYQRK